MSNGYLVPSFASVVPHDISSSPNPRLVNPNKTARTLVMFLAMKESCHPCDSLSVLKNNMGEFIARSSCENRFGALVTGIVMLAAMKDLGYDEAQVACVNRLL